MVFTLKKKTFKKDQKFKIFQRGYSMLFAKNQTFSQMYLWAHPARKNCFLIF